MPNKPLWLDRLPALIQQLRESPDPWLDRATLEQLLGIGKRRAQQLLAQIPVRRVGTSAVARIDDVIRHLEHLAAGEAAHYEHRRSRKLWTALQAGPPPVLVELPHQEMRRIHARDFEGLPEGVELAPGSITLRFTDPDEALRKLMALAMAIGRNRAAFEDRVSQQP